MSIREFEINVPIVSFLSPCAWYRVRLKKAGVPIKFFVSDNSTATKIDIFADGINLYSSGEPKPFDDKFSSDRSAKVVPLDVTLNIPNIFEYVDIRIESKFPASYLLNVSELINVELKDTQILELGQGKTFCLQSLGKDDNFTLEMENRVNARIEITCNNIALVDQQVKACKVNWNNFNEPTFLKVTSHDNRQIAVTVRRNR